jgi:glycosyltransferase involved in cell wall biosynthesis
MLNPSQTRSEVAVIVPCYNVEACLERALDSVFAQSYRDFRLFAVDDGSTDGTVQILAKYANRGVCTFQAHAGPAAARNRGIRLSESPFVAFLDADDEWLPAKLELQLALLKQDPGLGLVCSNCVDSEAGTADNSNSSTTALPKSGRLFESLARNCFVFTPTVVVRRECLKEIGLFNESLAVSEDFNLWLRIAARWNIAVLPETLANRHRRADSLSLTMDPKAMLLNGVAALKHVEATCSDLSPAESRALQSALAERIYCYGSYLLSTGEIAASRRKLSSVLKLRPTHWRAFAKLGLSALPTGVFQSLMGIRTKLGLGLRSGDSARI